MATLLVFILDSAAISTATFVTAFRTDFHKTFRVRQRFKTKPGVKAVRVSRAEHEPAQALQSGMRQHRGDQLFAQTLPPFAFLDEDIRQPGKRRKIGHDPCKTNLLSRMINAKTQGMVEGAVHRFRGHAPGPITALAEKTMDLLPVQPRRIVGNQQRIFMYFTGFHGNKKAPPVLPAGPENFLRDYRFEYWNRLRAPGWPYFLRSFMRESRVSRPSALSCGRRFASN